ncbi:MAG: hypothetical protein L3J30_07295 [Marinosulfonomonas sp.]|nr:hypothetical protein [Marinosulfonomonas sp.]
MTLYLKTGLVALMVLGACDDITKSGVKAPPTTAATTAATTAIAAPEKVRVSGKDVVIAGPHGFCIDPTETKDSANSAFVLLGSCAAISNMSHRPNPDIPAILMATVSRKSESAPIASSMVSLASFFKSEAGRAALSRDGKAKTVEVIETLDRNGVFYIHARDSSTGTLAGAGDEYWRALFNVKGRIVSVSVVWLEDQPISTAEGFETLGEFANRIKRENAVAVR